MPKFFVKQSVIIVLLTLLVCSGCGQTGPLYLPEPDEKSPTNESL